MARRAGSWLVAALPYAIVLATLGLSPWGLWEPDEGRYADIAQAMLDSGDFVTPRLNGAVSLDKPPLVYWVTAAGLALWGGGETGARFGQSLFAFGCLLLTWRLGRLLRDDRLGRLAALVLASSTGFFAAAHLLTLDLALTFFVTLSLDCFLRGWRQLAGPGGGGGRDRDRGVRWFLAMWAAAAAAVLTKGPIGIILPGLTLVTFLWLRGELRRPGDLRRLRALRPAAGILLFSVIAAPWYLAIAWRQPEFLEHFFYREHVLRFVSNVHDHAGPPWYPLAAGVLGLIPWSVAVPVLRVRRQGWAGARATLRSETGALIASWVLPALVLFTLARSKMPLYLLPVFPAAALALAAGIDNRRRPPAPGPAVARPSIGVGGVCLWMMALHLFALAIGRMDHLNETRHFASVLRSERGIVGAPVYFYDTYLRGLPFYLREPIPLIDYDRPREARASDPMESAVCPSSETRFLDRLRGPGRVFVVLRPRDLVRLQGSIDRPLQILVRSRRHLLVTNHAAAANRASSVLHPVGGLQ